MKCSTKGATQHLSSLKNSRKEFIRYVTRLTNKIHKTIEKLENTEVLRFYVWLSNFVIFKKLKGFIEVSLSPEERENANEIICEEDSRVI